MVQTMNADPASRPRHGLSIDDALTRFSPARLEQDLTNAHDKRAAIIERFPLDGWPTMSLEHYALGTDTSQESFCWWMEYGSKELGSIRGGNASKHLIYYRLGAPSGWHCSSCGVLSGTARIVWQA